MMSSNMFVESYADMRANFVIDAQLWNDDIVRSTLPAGDDPMARLTFDYTNALAAIRRGDLAVAREAVAPARSDRQRAAVRGKEQKDADPRGDQTPTILTEQLRGPPTAGAGKEEGG